MKPDQLAPLLLSLTSAEKKYFVQFTSIRSDNKSYMKLYDCVLRDGAFNADELSKELKKTKANLAHEKEYLIENVMKALRNYHDKLPDVSVNNMMSDVAILKEKELFQLAELKTGKAKKEAEKHSRFDAQWKLLSDEKFLLLTNLPFAKIQVAWNKQNHSMSERLNEMQNYSAFYHLGLQLQQQYLQSPAPVNAADIAVVKKLMAHPLFKKRFSHPYFRFQQHYLRTHLHSQLRQKDKMLFHMRHALRLIETEPHRIQANILLYTGCVNAYINALLGNRRFDEYFEFMQKLKNRYYRSLPFNQHYLDQRYEAYYFYYMFDYYLHNRHSAAALKTDLKKMMHHFEQQAVEIRKQFNDVQWLQVQRNAVNIYFFLLHDDDAALRWANTAINSADSAVANTLLSLIKITDLLIHVQLNNYDILPGLIKSAVRHIKQHGLYSAVEQETFSFIASLPKLLTAREKKEAFRKLKERYNYLKETLPETQKSFGRIFYDLWVERNLQP